MLRSPLLTTKSNIMKTELIQDAELVSNYIKGDENALAILIGRHKQKIYSFIYSKVYDKDITEDVFQDTFIKVIRTLKRGKYNEEGKFLPWVLRMAHNLCIDNYRKTKRKVSIVTSEEFDLFEILPVDRSKQSQLLFFHYAISIQRSRLNHL